MWNEHDQVEKCVEMYLKSKKIFHRQIQIKLAKDLGSNFMSTIVEITVEWKVENEKQIESSFIGKLAKTDKQFRQKVPVQKFFVNEIFMYEFVLPEFIKIQKQHKIINMFQSYADFCMSSKEDLKETIVLKNMVPKGFKLYNRGTTLDYDHALILIREIGRLHALSFATRDQQQNIFRKIIKGLPEVEFHGGKRAMYNKYLMTMIYPQCMQLLDPLKDRTAYNQYKSFEEFFFDKVQRAIERSCLGSKAVVTHSDLWTSNLLYKYNEINQPNEICLLDWQLTKVSSPASDISQIMFLCLDKETRDKHYDDLIDAYYTSFSKFLHELGSDPEVLFSYSTLQEHLKKYSVHGLYIAIRTIAFTSTTEAMTPRSSDENSFDAICCTRKDTERFNKRVRDILLDYIRYGYEL